MRKLFALIAVLGMLTIGASKLMAQEDEAAPAAQTEQTTVSIDDEQIESTSMHAAIKQKFIEGGAGFMACVVLCLIFGLAIKLILTNVLVPDEAAFLGILTVCCMLYSLLMLIIGIMRIHDFSFSRFCATAVFAVIGILIIIFLIMLMFLLSQQLFGWLGTIFVELRYR